MKQVRSCSIRGFFVQIFVTFWRIWLNSMSKSMDNSNRKVQPAFGSNPEQQIILSQSCRNKHLETRIRIFFYSITVVCVSSHVEQVTSPSFMNSKSNKNTNVGSFVGARSTFFLYSRFDLHCNLIEYLNQILVYRVIHIGTGDMIMDLVHIYPRQ